ncbi:hypothetical protein VTI74DRAFT_7471 [Chaetomium olivicolor]
MPAAVASRWRDRRRMLFQSVFQTDVVHPAPHSTPTSHLTQSGQPLGRPGERSSSRRTTPEPRPTAHPLLPSLPVAGEDDQATYDSAWHIVTAHIALPSSATADDSSGTLAADSQQRQQQSSHRRDANPDFYDAFALLVNAPTLLPRAARTDDILAWHVRQVRAHFSQHVIPLLARCVDDLAEEESGDDDNEDGNDRQRAVRKADHYEKHMVVVMSSIRTLEAALRLYFYGLTQLLSGFSRLADSSPEVAKDAEVLNARFRRDIHALVSNSVSEGLLRSVKAVLSRLAGVILGIQSQDEPGTGKGRPAPPEPGDLKVHAARERLLELIQQLHNVGLAGERFQVLFAEVMDAMMCAFVTEAYAGVWSVPDTRSFSAAMDSVPRSGSQPTASPCIMSLNDWVENHFARLSFEVLSCISPNPQGPSPGPLTELKTYQSLALGRLAALRIHELFDIVLAWPASRPALDDLRATITTPARRRQLTDSFSRTLQTRLLHPGCSTLEILRTYISIIRTLHALDPSKVLLSHVEPGLQLYLCQREDAVRVVVAGLLASPEEIRAARKAKDAHKRQRDMLHKDEEARPKRRRDLGPFATPTMPSKSTRAPATRRRRRSTPEPDLTFEHGTTPPKTTHHPLKSADKLVELALILNDPSQTRRTPAPSDDHDLDWSDMTWVPDPVDAGAGYRRPKSEDVIGTLITALGGGRGSAPAPAPASATPSSNSNSGSGDVFIKEFSLVVAERLLSRGFGGDHPARFDQELRVLELLKKKFGEPALQNCDVMIKDVVQDSRKVDAAMGKMRSREMVAEGVGDVAEMEYHAKILSRLFWPGLEREHFLLPDAVLEQQRWYEKGYESLKSGRRLTWLNQLGQARVEIELSDRTVAVDCSTVEATVVYAFQGGEGDGEAPVKKSVEELYEQLQMDEDLITAALQFWVVKGVLRRVAGSPNTYVVAETLSEETTATGTDEQPPITDLEPEPATTAAKPAISAKERERREMYWRYIQGMLTNASTTMPLAQMAMMMKMLIADGFPWSNEELQEFLAEKVAEGQMEVVGGKYKLVKK